MTAAENKSTNSAEKLLRAALVVSIVLHLAAFGGWKWGQTHGLWKRLSFPAWMNMLPKNLTAALAKKLPPPVPPPQPTPMLFIDVDPNLAAAQPPPDAKYYSSSDTLAANPTIKTPSKIPDIAGHQDQVMKTVAPAVKPAPLQPSPPKKEETPVKEASSPPKPSYTPGDLVFAKPQEKPETNKVTPENGQGTAPKEVAQPVRPRTLAKAREQQGIPGERSRQDGGVARLGLDPSMNVMKTPYGDYDRDFIDAVRARWYELLQDRQANVPGKVVLEFNLHADGRITDMKMPVNEVNELLAVICQQAIEDPSPYKPWTAEMRRLLTDPRPLRFTFYYEN